MHPVVSHRGMYHSTFCQCMYFGNLTMANVRVVPGTVIICICTVCFYWYYLQKKAVWVYPGKCLGISDLFTTTIIPLF